MYQFVIVYILLIDNNNKMLKGKDRRFKDARGKKQPNIQTFAKAERLRIFKLFKAER
jgi:hypothetical protein